jgi:hypothetical protein
LENLVFYAIKIKLAPDAYFSSEEIKTLFEFEKEEYSFGICAAADLSKVAIIITSQKLYISNLKSFL